MYRLLNGRSIAHVEYRTKCIRSYTNFCSILDSTFEGLTSEKVSPDYQRWANCKIIFVCLNKNSFKLL